MRILFLTWRDTRNPEGGGSEVYLENVAATLAAAGHDVTVFCALFPGAPALEYSEGVRFVRRGQKLGVHLEAMKYLRNPTYGAPDITIDVQNGIPFFTRPVTRSTPTVLVCHHVHREQWPIVYGPVRSRIGWTLESKVSPYLYRDCLYIAACTQTKHELTAMGVDPGRITVIHPGVPPTPALDVIRAERPTILVLGRLVPHKQVEHVLYAAAELRREIPSLNVRIVGDGWWTPQLKALVAELDLADTVDFVGFVDESTKHIEIARSWVLALPSLKEGWGLVVIEAAQQGVPSIAYAQAGGVTESIRHGDTGWLAEDQSDFTEKLGTLLTDDIMRKQLGENAREFAGTLSWQATADSFADVLARCLGADALPLAAIDPIHLSHEEGAPATAPRRFRERVAARIRSAPRMGRRP